MATEHETHKVTDDGTVLVPLKLAHPMSKAYAANARVDHVRDYKVGDTVWVTREYGNALIDAGQVQVDPEDHKARQRVLLLNHRNAPLTAKEVAELLAREADADGSGDADAAVSARTDKPATAAAKSSGK